MIISITIVSKRQCIYLSVVALIIVRQLALLATWGRQQSPPWSMSTLPPRLTVPSNSTARADETWYPSTEPTETARQQGHQSRTRRKGAVEYEREFPYATTCPYFEEHDRLLIKSRDGSASNKENVTIALAYHVGMVKNWRTVVLDQLQTLHQCGLGHAARHLILSYSGGEMGQLTDLLKPTYHFPQLELVRAVRAERVPWEGPIMNEVQEYCTENPEAVVFYFHNKGVSRYGPDWRNVTDQPWTYSRVLYWRKFMEYFTIERPQLCLDMILNGNKSACGCNFERPPHFSGNYWVASCQYLVKLPPLNLTASRLDYEAADLWFYEAGEMWIGRRYSESRFVSLWQRKLETQFALYRHWIQPSEYRFHEDYKSASAQSASSLQHSSLV
jgi:hypothetical protein